MYDISASTHQKSVKITIRFPLHVIEKINLALTGTDVSFSSFVIQSCEFVLDNMDHSGNSKNT